MSSRTRNAVEWRDPLASDRGRRDSSLRYFAPLGLVRRFVEMLLQAGISPCVGRNDGGRVTRPNFAPLGLVRRFVGASPQGEAFLFSRLPCARGGVCV